MRASAGTLWPAAITTCIDTLILLRYQHFCSNGHGAIAIIIEVTGYSQMPANAGYLVVS